MAIDIPFSASVDLGEGDKSIKSLKQDYKEAQKELDGLTVGTEGYVNQLKKLGKIKDDIGDLNAEINSFNPEGKVHAFSNVIGGLASGFQAATGAAALFGGESKDVEKALLKVQAVMAFTEGIKGVVALGDGFKVLSNIIKANPIMFIATIIIAATVAIYAFTKSLGDNTEKQLSANEAQKKFSEELEKQIGIIKKRNTIANDGYKSEIEQLKARGATIEEVNKKEDEVYKKRRQQLLYIQGYRGQLSADESKELLALTNEKILRSEQYVKKVGDDLESLTKKQKEENEKQAADNKTNHQKYLDENAAAENKAADDYDSRKKKQKDDAKKAEIDGYNQGRDDAQKMLADYNTDLLAGAELKAIQNQGDIQAQLAFLQMKMEIELQNTELTENQKLLIKQKYADQESALKTKGYSDDLQLAQETTTGLTALSDLYFSIKSANTKKGSKEAEADARKQFKLNKAFSISSAIISGLQGVVNGLSAPYPQNIILPILAGVTTVASVAKIAATQFNGGGGGASIGAIPSAPSGGDAPVINAPRNSTTLLNPDGTVKTPAKTDTPIVKAIVVETDISKTQKRVGVIESSATIGSSI